MWLRPRLLAVLAFGLTIVLSQEEAAATAAAPKAEVGEASTDVVLPDVVLPTPSPEPTPTSEQPFENIEDNADDLTAKALSRLKKLIDSEGVRDAAALLEHAQKLGKSGKRRSALPLLTSIVAAASSGEVSRANSSAAAIELGHMCARHSRWQSALDQARPHVAVTRCCGSTLLYSPYCQQNHRPSQLLCWLTIRLPVSAQLIDRQSTSPVDRRDNK